MRLKTMRKTKRLSTLRLFSRAYAPRNCSPASAPNVTATKRLKASAHAIHPAVHATAILFESGIPPHFRVTGENLDRVVAETTRPDGAQQVFKFERRGAFWQSVDEIPEPHGFKVSILAGRGTRDDRFGATFSEHEHGAHDYEGHGHAHDRPKTGKRTALLLILGSSPMVEGIPAFFAAGRYGIPLILVMSLVFAATTIVTYVVLCVGSVMGLKRVSLGPLEAYGEVLSGAFIALVGIVFWVFPVL